MKPRDHVVIVTAIENGVASGLRRYYKHLDTAPDEHTQADMADVVVCAVLDSVSEWFTFDGDED
jgi:hypothetical protein